MKHFILVLLLVLAGHLAALAQVTMKKEDGGILLFEKGENVFFYQSEPKNQKGKYERLHYIHPLWAPDGAALTEDFPADHLHHRGVFWAWHQVWIGDKKIGDPWEIKGFEQRISDLEFMTSQDGSGILKMQVEWKSPEWKKEGRMVPYIIEESTIKISPRFRNVRRIDFEISLLAQAENLRIGGSEDEKGYSGFSVRMVLPDDVKFSGAQGPVVPQNTAVASPGYVNVSGSMGKAGKPAGIVIADHPDNPGYPQPWILRSKNSMQNAAFPGSGTVPVLTTEPLVLKYTLLVYTGKVKDRTIRRIISR
jgi:hypothetical protein